MTKPTAKEIKAEVSKLVEMKPHVRHHTAFGDDNHKAIEAQIKVLDEAMSEDRIFDLWDNDDHLLDAALEARAWMDGNAEDGTPSEGWSSLVSR